MIQLCQIVFVFVYLKKAVSHGLLYRELSVETMLEARRPGRRILHAYSLGTLVATEVTMRIKFLFILKIDPSGLANRL
jgi:hypothetical protein